MPDAQQDIAKDWKSFSPERRSRLLSKMTADQKHKLRLSLEGGDSQAPDFTANPDKEGTYRMLDKGGNDIYVPYSSIRSAAQGGYTMAPEDRPRFVSDAAADKNLVRFFPDINLGKGVRITGMNPAGDPIFGPMGTAPQGSTAKRFLSSTSDVLKGTASGMYHSLKEGPQNAEEAGTEYLSGPLGLRAKRLIIDPMLSEGRKAIEEAKQGNFLSWKEPTPEQARHQALAVGHGLAAALPLAAPVAPWAMMAPVAAQASEQAGQQAGSGDYAGAAGTVTGYAAPIAVTEGVTRGAPRVWDAATKKYRPVNVNIGGMQGSGFGGADIPVAVGEADPMSKAGQTQLRLKRSGVGQERFEKLQQEQLAQVKQAMRKVAEDTAGITDLPEEPGVAMEDAATATFNHAKPMYSALDRAAITIPGTFDHVTGVLRKAVNKARDLGVEFDIPEDLSKIRPEADGTIQWGGMRISKATHPDLWAQEVANGVIDDTGHVTPLTAFQKVRSELYRMQRATQDAGLKFRIGKTIEALNGDIAAALKNNPDLLENWKQADKLWAKGYALRTIADEIKNSTRGTPVEYQAEGLAKVPQKLQTSSLVRTLNELDENGLLGKAFTEDEEHNLRASVNILERSEETPIGRGQGEAITHGRPLTHLLRGRTGPITGAVVGAVIGGLTDGLRGAVGGAGTGALLGGGAQLLWEKALVKVMTTTEGVRELQAIERAKTQTQRQLALKALTATVAAQNRKPAKSPKDLRNQAQRLAPAGATATY